MPLSLYRSPIKTQYLLLLFLNANSNNLTLMQTNSVYSSNPSTFCLSSLHPHITSLIIQDHTLTVSVMDWDRLNPFDELIGETKIDLENRYMSRHRATCGLPKTFCKCVAKVWARFMHCIVIHILCIHAYILT